jgi:hypothetical protein
MTRPELSQRRNGIVVVDDDAACIMVHLDGGIRDRNNDASSLDLCILKWTTKDALEVVRLFFTRERICGNGVELRMCS